MDKKDYLKKYLSKSSSDSKKKKRKTVKTSSAIRKSRIVDDDIDLSKIQPIDENELDIYDLAEDAPQIAGIIDDRPDEIKVLSKYKEAKKWKVVTKEYEDVKVSAVGNADSDHSPPRNREKRRGDSEDSDINVARKSKRNEDSDESPPRRSKKKGAMREDSDGDLSPPRKAHHTRRDSSSPRRPKEEHSRRKAADDSDGDLSPPRKRNKSRDDIKYSSHSKEKNRGSDSDISPPRKSHKKRFEDVRRSKSVEDDDFSPPRRTSGMQNDKFDSRRHGSKQEDGLNGARMKTERRHEDDNRHSRSDRSKKHEHDSGKKTLDGKKAGLQNAADMKQEAELLRRRQAESLAQLGDDVSGRGAATIMRDKKTGRIRDFKEETRQKREKEAKAAEIVEQYAVWGKGMKQIEERTERMKSDHHEMSKPVARYANDEDLEEMRRNEEKEGDPMLEYMRNKRKKEGKSVSVKHMYQGSFNPNRYNIRPGHRWDGVDRSNGYEKQWFEEKSNRKALEEEAFKWSTEDM